MPETELILDSIRFPAHLLEEIKCYAWTILEKPKSSRRDIDIARELIMWCWWQRELGNFFSLPSSREQEIKEWRDSEAIREQKFQEYDKCPNKIWIKSLG